VDSNRVGSQSVSKRSRATHDELGGGQSCFERSEERSQGIEKGGGASREKAKVVYPGEQKGGKREEWGHGVKTRCRDETRWAAAGNPSGGRLCGCARKGGG